jgi:DNA-binding NtrC family response regulator
VGSEQEIEVDVRIVSATHRPLESMVAAGKLREDLYHRLGVFVVELPALRERSEDIPALLDHFAAEAGRELGIGVSVCADAVSAASRYRWPGNIRALRNAVFRAAALADGPVTAADLLPRRTTAPIELCSGELLDVPHAAWRGPREESRVEMIELEKGDYRTMRRSMLAHVVRQEGSIRRAARVLNIPRSTLGAWLKR